MEKPTLTKEQIEYGYHIFIQFSYLDRSNTVKDGQIQRHHKNSVEHWKQCPCKRDVRLK